jgi:hypothetical protein
MGLMATIGAVSFDTLHGNAVKEAEIVEQWSRMGTDGSGARKVGKRSRPLPWTGTKWSDSAAAADTHVETCQALAGTVVTITDEWGIERTNCLIVSADPLQNDRGDHISQVLVAGALKYETKMMFRVLRQE